MENDTLLNKGKGCNNGNHISSYHSASMSHVVTDEEFAVLYSPLRSKENMIPVVFIGSPKSRKNCFGITSLVLFLIVTVQIHYFPALGIHLRGSSISPMGLLGSLGYSSSNKNGKVVVVQVVKLRMNGHSTDDDSNDDHGANKSQKVVVVQVVKMGDSARHDDKSPPSRDNHRNSDSSHHDNENDNDNHNDAYSGNNVHSNTTNSSSVDNNNSQSLLGGNNSNHEETTTTTSTDSDDAIVSPRRNDDDYKKYYGKYIDARKPKSSVSSINSDEADNQSVPGNTSSSTGSNVGDDESQNKDQTTGRKRHDDGRE